MIVALVENRTCWPSHNSVTVLTELLFATLSPHVCYPLDFIWLLLSAGGTEKVCELSPEWEFQQKANTGLVCICVAVLACNVGYHDCSGASPADVYLLDDWLTFWQTN
jgi:hypothetical protein